MVFLAGAALIAATLVTLLVLVQRIQPSPFPAGATQIACLSPDPDFEVPSSFLVGARDEVTAYGGSAPRLLRTGGHAAGDAVDFRDVAVSQPAHRTRCRYWPRPRRGRV